MAGTPLLELRKKDLTPIHRIETYSEEDLFDAAVRLIDRARLK